VRVLLKDKSDNTFFAAHVECAGYDVDEQVLWFSFHGAGATVSMDFGSAQAFLKDLFHDDFCDLPHRFATIVWED
jgi:hypothetical protein